MKARRRESDIQGEILRLLRARGMPAWPMNREAGVRRALGNQRIAAKVGGQGFADIVAIRRLYGPSGGVVVGQFVAIEVKAPGSRTARTRQLTQAAFGDTVAKAGGLYLRIDPRSPRTACEQVCDALGWA
jgi:hypothetical protein